MSENIIISGQVQGYHDQKPIYGIRVSAYRDRQLVVYDYTYNEQGMYQLSVPAGTPITVRFDTHWSLTTATEWHPSVIANIDAKQNIVLPNRFLMRVGVVENETAAIDALTAYQFCAMWTAIEKDRDSARHYAETAASRMGLIKFILPEHQEIQRNLQEFFFKQAQSS